MHLFYSCRCPFAAFPALLTTVSLSTLSAMFILSDARAEQAAAIQLKPITITRFKPREDADKIYSEPGSSVYISGADIDRFGRLSPADLLKGQPGVQMGDSRNGGGIDVNIRGVQGQSRVAVTVDGAQQALDVYRGYAGAQQRSYIDSDFIGGVTINKGPSLAASSSGAIGGTVSMRTINADDILLPGKSYGARLKGELWNNGVKPADRSAEAPANEALLKVTPRDERDSFFDSDAKSGSAVAAYRNDYLDLVAGYAIRNQGNYFAGKHGREPYREFDQKGREKLSVAKNFMEGDEVLNSSSRTRSFLLKSRLHGFDGHELQLTYNHFDGSFGEIMPSDIIRDSTAGIVQYPFGLIKMDTISARYNFDPDNNDFINLKANLWYTDAKTDQLNTVTAPKSQFYISDRGWTRLQNQRLGGDVSNRSELATKLGDFALDFGGAFQLEKIAPQSDVAITQHDLNANRFLRDGDRQSFSLSAKLEYSPLDHLKFWAGGRYNNFASHDKNRKAKPRHEEKRMQSIMVNKPKAYGYLDWLPDANGKYTPATDPRLNNGIVYNDSNYPFDGAPYNEWGAQTSKVYKEKKIDTVVGYDFSNSANSRDDGFAPAAGVQYNLTPDTFIYATYTEALRMPSLFETTLGTVQVGIEPDLKPEHARNWEFGASTSVKDIVTADDSASFKLAYFNNNITDYISRYYSVATGSMSLTNADSFKVSGIEFQSKYDSGRFFTDLSATYYFKTQTCDARFAAVLRKAANRYTLTGDTPDCTPGSFMGSYANTQNPPKYAINLTAGARFFDETLTIGGRMVHTAGPTEKLDSPWQTGATTPQLPYLPVTVFDAFVSYKINDNAELNASIQNITDRYYIDPLALSMMPAPGRTIRAGFTATF